MLPLPKISAGWRVVAGLDVDGELWLTGVNYSGQQLVGYVDPGGNPFTPEQDTIYPAHKIPGGPWKDVSFGSGHGLLLDPEGTVYSWGENYDGQLGIGVRSEPRPTLQSVQIGKCKFIAAGDYYSTFVTVNDEVYMCGYNDMIEHTIGGGVSTTPVKVLEGVGEIVYVHEGTYISSVLTASGEAWGLGVSKYGNMYPGFPGAFSIQTPPGTIASFIADGSAAFLTDTGHVYEMEEYGGPFILRDIPEKVIDMRHEDLWSMALGVSGNIYEIDLGVVKRLDLPRALRLGFKSETYVYYLKEDGWTGARWDPAPMWGGYPLYLGVPQPGFFGWSDSDVYSRSGSTTLVDYPSLDATTNEDGTLLFTAAYGEFMMHIEDILQTYTHVKFESYSNHAGLIQSINTIDSPELFEYSYDLATWYPFPKDGLTTEEPVNVKAHIFVGPNREVWVKPFISGDEVNRMPYKRMVGGEFTLHFLDAKGDIYSRGFNRDGQLGTGGSTDPVWSYPVKVSDIGGFISLAAGDVSTIALHESGKVYGWGTNYDGEIRYPKGDIVYTPVEMDFPGTVVQIASSAYMNFALNDAGEVWMRGYNYMELDPYEGESNTGAIDVVTRLAFDKPVKNIEAGPYNLLLEDFEGNIYTTGLNKSGECGIGMVTDYVRRPVLITSDVEDYAVGDYAIAIVKEGKLYVAGHNGYVGEGLLGVNPALNQPDYYGSVNVLPSLTLSEAVQGNVVKVDGGYYHSGFVYLDDKGNLYSLGDLYQAGLEGMEGNWQLGPKLAFTNVKDFELTYYVLLLKFNNTGDTIYAVGKDVVHGERESNYSTNPTFMFDPNN